MSPNDEISSSENNINPELLGVARAHRWDDFVVWLNKTHPTWERVREEVPREYEDHLLHERGFAPSTVYAHTSTIRAVVDENHPRHVTRMGSSYIIMTPPERDPTKKYKMVRRGIVISKVVSDTTFRKMRDTRPDRLRLTTEEANALPRSPGWIRCVESATRLFLH